MKLLVVLFASAALCAGSAVPLIPGDNSHYVEGQSRYIWMPDNDQNPVLVDLHMPVDEEQLRTARNGADNEYWLYTRNNPTDYQLLVDGDLDSVHNSNYNSNLPLKVIVHGWNNNGDSEVNTLIRDAFLEVGDVNVIVVDWSGLANGFYTVADLGVPDVGVYLGNFVQWLIDNAGGDWNHVHFVGFSLGAHVVGNAGRAVNGQVIRVTGLDPAGPQWGGNDNALNTASGVYVESIHTDGGLLGIFDPISHADFYPNGGRFPQPGCGLSNICSHGRSYQLFAATVRFNHLIGNLCVNIAEAELSYCTGDQLLMGTADLNKSGSGLYGLLTGSSWPF